MIASALMRLSTICLLVGSTWAVGGPIITSPLPPAPVVKDFSIRAPVNVATHLYSGCVAGTMQANYDIEPTRVGINAFVQELDVRCLTWMLIWYPTLMNGEDFTERTQDVERFNANRLRILQSVTNELRKLALIR